MDARGAGHRPRRVPLDEFSRQGGHHGDVPALARPPQGPEDGRPRLPSHIGFGRPSRSLRRRLRPRRRGDSPRRHRTRGLLLSRRALPRRRRRRPELCCGSRHRTDVAASAQRPPLRRAGDPHSPGPRDQHEAPHPRVAGRPPQQGRRRRQVHRVARRPDHPHGRPPPRPEDRQPRPLRHDLAGRHRAGLRRLLLRQLLTEWRILVSPRGHHSSVSSPSYPLLLPP
mmetsp:Transcript_36074/g.115501  ORF Transcript_36074/g.115501 Transcript_36074/m.115501 type:complete len:226 (+) Transcript_36074:497-1174(+)